MYSCKMNWGKFCQKYVTLIQKFYGVRIIGESENKYQNEAKDMLSERRYCSKTSRKALSLF